MDGYRISDAHQKNQGARKRQQSSEGEDGEDYEEDDFEEEELGDDHGDIDYGDEGLDGVQFDDGSGGYDDELLDEAQ